MLPGLRIDKTQGAVELENYIVSIVGATRTSKQFEALLNETYRVHQEVAVWESPLGVN